MTGLGAIPFGSLNSDKSGSCHFQSTFISDFCQILSKLNFLNKKSHLLRQAGRFPDKVARTCPSKFDFMLNQTDLEFNQWTYRKTNATAKWEGSLPVNLRPEQPAKREGQDMWVWNWQAIARNQGLLLLA